MTDNYQPAERRPIATRELPVTKKMASWLASTGISPNAISTWGMVSGILAGASLAATSRLAHDGSELWMRVCWVGGAVFVQLRLAANMFDGMVALETGQASPVGELYNEVPDRISDAATLGGLGYAVGGDPAVGLLAALLAVMTAYVRAMGKAAGARNDFCGPMAKPQRMFLVTVVSVFMALTPAGWHRLPFGEQPMGIPTVILVLIIVGCLLTVWRRLSRIATQLRSKAQ